MFTDCCNGRKYCGVVKECGVIHNHVYQIWNVIVHWYLPDGAPPVEAVEANEDGHPIFGVTKAEITKIFRAGTEGAIK